MARALLATFIHISDLHFGTLVRDPQTGDFAPDAQTYKFWAYFPWFDGLLGHHHRALPPLADLVRLLRKTENAKLIVTGDVTSYGAGGQFDLADDFLVSQLILPNVPQGVGLFEQDWRDHAIPGNHDHWPGRLTIVGKPTKALSTYFPYLPNPNITNVALGKWQLRLVRINSDADVGPSSFARTSARGSFTSQLDPAALKLGPPQANEVRILLLHHSRVWPQFTLGMKAASRTALDTFLADQNIRVLLTGHIHIPALDIFTPGTDSADVLEARCGTTTVRDIFPYTWTTILGRPLTRRLPPNSLLVHRLYEDEDQKELWWVAQVYTRTPLGFRAVRAPQARKELRVWP